MTNPRTLTMSERQFLRDLGFVMAAALAGAAMGPDEWQLCIAQVCDRLDDHAKAVIGTEAEYPDPSEAF